MSSISQVFRIADGFSLAALRALLVSGPAAARLVVGKTLQATGDLKSEHALTSWDLVRAFPIDDTVVIHGNDWMDGTISPLERYVLAHLIRYFRPAVLLEVGTFRGTTTRLLLDNVPQQARLYSIDLPPTSSFSDFDGATDERLIRHRRVGLEFANHPLAANVSQILGNTFEKATWQHVPGDLDFAFIDASHSYEAVKNDTERVREKLSSSGIMIWHDYSRTDSRERGVGKFIREQMSVSKDIFICPGTSLAIRVPEDELRRGRKRIEACFPDGDYHARHPDGGAAWLDG